MTLSAPKPADRLAAALEWIYDNATSGSVELAESYRLKSAGDCERCISDLICTHVRYAAFVGFATNFGGLLSTPVAAPLNVSSVIIIQVRMVAAIAHLRGYSLHDQKVKYLVLICLAGSSAAGLLQELGYSVGRRLTVHLIEKTSRMTLRRFHAALGRHLLIRYVAQKSYLSAAPIVGGVVGAVIDASVTRGIGGAAKLIFKPQGPQAYA